MADSITSGSFPFPPIWNGALGYGYTLGNQIAYTLQTLNSTSEAVAYYGRMNIADGSATKILSAGLGQIMFRTGTNTWQALSVLAIGLQTVGSGIPIRPSETFLASTTTTASGGGAAVLLPSTSWITVTMASGAATLTHGSLWSVVFNLTTRVSTDSVQIAHVQKSAATNAPGNEFPCGNMKDGGAWTNTGGNSIAPAILLKCDDGTLAWLSNSFPAHSVTSFSISSGGTNNEYGMRFALPWTSAIDGFGATVRHINSTADYTVLLYSDPDGTPATVTSYAVLGLQAPALGAAACRQTFPTSLITLTASVTYMLAVRGDTGAANGAVSVQAVEFADASHKIAISGWGGLALGARGGGAGAFSMAETRVPAFFHVNVHQISGGGTTTVTTTTTTTITTTVGGPRVHPGMGGGARG